eukprot:g4711.t1
MTTRDDEWEAYSKKLAAWKAPKNESGGWAHYPCYLGPDKGYTGVQEADVKQYNGWTRILTSLMAGRDQVQLKWVDHRGFVSAQYTGQEIHDLVCLLAHRIRTEVKAKHGDRIILSYPPTGLDFYFVYLACIKQGVVAVPVYPPSPGRLVTDLERLCRIVDTCKATEVLTDNEYGKARQLLKVKSAFAKGKWPKAKWHILDLKWAHKEKRKKTSAAIIRAEAEAKDRVLFHDLAFLQFTSGSTGDPKGVMVSHGNLVENARVINWCSPRPHIAVSWLPMYHDMGLIGFFATISEEGRWVTMSPFTFLKNPAIWIHCLSREKATFSPFPNFALELVLRKWQNMPELLGGQPLDLSRLLFLLNGAEPIKLSSEDKFLAFFGKHGLREDVFYNCYGLAEHTLLATVCMDRGRKAAKDPDGVVRVSCGPPAGQVDLRVVDPDTCEELPVGTVGEIWLSSGSKALGYYARPEVTEEIFFAKLAPARQGKTGRPQVPGRTYLRTGDLGFLKDGEVYFTGRVKDLIIIKGRNYYPQDLELTVEQTAHVRPGCVACFAVDTDDGEAAAIVAEILVKDSSIKKKAALQTLYQQLAEDIERNVIREHGVPVCRVALIKDRSIPKTTSGKIRRRNTKDALLGGSLSFLYQHVSKAPAEGASDAASASSAAGERKSTALEQKSAADLELTAPSASETPAGSGKPAIAADRNTVQVAANSTGRSALSQPTAIATSSNQALPSLDQVVEWLKTTVEMLIQRERGAVVKINSQDSLLESGLTSVQAVEITTHIDREFGLSLLPVTVFNYPTVQALAEHILQQLLKRGGSGEEGADMLEDAQAVVGFAFALGSQQLQQITDDSKGYAAALWQAMLTPSPADGLSLFHGAKVARVDLSCLGEGFHVYLAGEDAALTEVLAAVPGLATDGVSMYSASLEAVHQARLDLLTGARKARGVRAEANEESEQDSTRAVSLALIVTYDAPSSQRRSGSNGLESACTALVLRPLASALAAQDQGKDTEKTDTDSSEVAMLLVGSGLEQSCGQALEAALQSSQLPTNGFDFLLAASSRHSELEKLDTTLTDPTFTDDRQTPLVLSHLPALFDACPASAGALTLLQALLALLQGAVPPGARHSGPHISPCGAVRWAGNVETAQALPLPHSLADRFQNLHAGLMEGDACIVVKEYAPRRRPRSLLWNGSAPQRANWPKWLL